MVGIDGKNFSMSFMESALNALYPKIEASDKKELLVNFGKLFVTVYSINESSLSGADQEALALFKAKFREFEEKVMGESAMDFPPLQALPAESTQKAVDTLEAANLGFNIQEKRQALDVLDVTMERDIKQFQGTNPKEWERIKGLARQCLREGKVLGIDFGSVIGSHIKDNVAVLISEVFDTALDVARKCNNELQHVKHWTQKSQGPDPKTIVARYIPGRALPDSESLFRLVMLMRTYPKCLYGEVQRALDFLKRAGFPVIMASSTTRASAVMIENMGGYRFVQGVLKICPEGGGDTALSKAAPEGYALVRDLASKVLQDMHVEGGAPKSLHVCMLDDKPEVCEMAKSCGDDGVVNEKAGSPDTLFKVVKDFFDFDVQEALQLIEKKK